MEAHWAPSPKSLASESDVVFSIVGYPSAAVDAAAASPMLSRLPLPPSLSHRRCYPASLSLSLFHRRCYPAGIPYLASLHIQQEVRSTKLSNRALDFESGDGAAKQRVAKLRICNVAAGKLFGIPLSGTHSHAFVSSFMSTDEITDKSLQSCDGKNVCEDFVSLAQAWLSKIKRSHLLSGIFGETNQSELAVFASYALVFPNSFLALVDTYDVMRSGVPNFCAVALALNEFGDGWLDSN